MKLGKVDTSLNYLDSNAWDKAIELAPNLSAYYLSGETIVVPEANH